MVDIIQSFTATAAYKSDPKIPSTVYIQDIGELVIIMIETRPWQCLVVRRRSDWLMSCKKHGDRPTWPCPSSDIACGTVIDTT
jgi:hypothetical protein